MHVVVLEERDPPLELGVAGELVDALEHFLARVVGRVRLAGEDDLHRAPRVHQQAPQPLEVAEDQVGALVGGEAAGEPDGERVGIEQRPGADHLRRFLEARGEAPARLLADPGGEHLLEAQVRRPELAVVEGEHLVPEAGLVEPVAPVAAEVLVEQLHDRRSPSRWRGARRW